MKKKLGGEGTIHKRAQALSDKLDADVLFYSGPIDTPYDYYLIGRVKRFKKRPNVILLLTTGGGSADAAYRMMRYLHTAYQDGTVTLFVNAFCKSAGTLMAVGCDELVMSDVAEIGPLDVQLRKPDEVGEWASGLTPLQALAALRAEAFNCFEQHFLALREKSGRQITAKTASEIATKLTVGWFQPIYEQLDPMRLSETQRAMMIAWEYGVRLVRKNISEDGLNSLISAYPSHGFIIDRQEAADLFERVRPPSAEETALASALTMAELVDEGINGSEPKIIFIGKESCGISDDNAWEGDDSDDAAAPLPAAADKQHRNHRKADGAGNAKPVRARRGAAKAGTTADNGSEQADGRA